MATHRLRPIFLLLVLALVLTTTGCRGTTGSRSGHGGSHSGGSGLHLPWFSSSHEPDPEQSLFAEMPDPWEEFRAVPPEMPSGGWRAPLAAPLRVTRRFEPPPTPYAAGHRGVDLAGLRGQEVRSAGIGYVAWSGVLAGRGVVVVQHNEHDSELRTTYEPVAAVVTRGTFVRAGERIGILQAGHPGCPVAACLHWGLLRGVEYLDPMSLLTDEVRLLPLGKK